MTSFFDAVIALVVAGTINAFIVRAIRRRLPGPEGAVLSNIYMTTLALRMALALFLNAYSGQTTFADMFWGDSSTYDYGGWVMSMRWGGDVMLNRYMEGRVSGWGFFYFVGALYYLFGHNQLLVQFMNGTIGALTVLVIYAIGKHLFDVEVAQWAARFMAFFPQVVFWSGAIYKDPAVMFCIAACMYAVLKLSVKLSPRYVVLFVAAALALMSLRFYVFYFVAFATLGTFVLSQRRGMLASVASYVTVLGVFVGAFAFAASRETLEEQKSYLSFERLQITRTDQATWGHSAIEAADVSTPQGALSALPTGLVYLLFAPFPWALRGIRQMLTLPETLVWYALWPAMVRGLMQTFRHRLRPALPILVFAASLTVAYAVFQGNVGTAYRQRTQVTMFYFIFMAAGLVQRRRQRAQAQVRAQAAEPAFPLP